MCQRKWHLPSHTFLNFHRLRVPIFYQSMFPIFYLTGNILPRRGFLRSLSHGYFLSKLEMMRLRGWLTPYTAAKKKKVTQTLKFCFVLQHTVNQNLGKNWRCFGRRRYKVTSYSRYYSRCQETKKHTSKVSLILFVQPQR